MYIYTIENSGPASINCRLLAKIYFPQNYTIISLNIQMRILTYMILNKLGLRLTFKRKIKKKKKREDHVCMCTLSTSQEPALKEVR